MAADTASDEHRSRNGELAVDPVTVGLDIGSSAVRAAELHVGKDGRRTLRRYGQVGLAPGQVVDGEVHNPPAVAAALRRLWEQGGFSTTEVVLGVSGPRVFVRQADVEPLPAEELRPWLKFGAQELVPIPMEDASFDFSLLGPPETDGDGRTTQRILLVAAHRELLRTYVETLKEAGLRAKVMDAAPLALMRAVPSAGSDLPGAEVIISIGAELTTVAVREEGVPRFIRSLTIGGAKLTEKLAGRMHLELAVAERLKRGGAGSAGAHVQKILGPEVRELAEEVRATIDFFVSQAGGAEVSRLVVTGGAAQTEGMTLAVAGNLPAPVVALDPLAGIDTRPSGLDQPELARVAAAGSTAVGLALWPTEAPLIRLSVLPDEVAAALRSRRMVTRAGTGLAVLAGLLAVASAGQLLAVRSEEGKVHAEKARAAVLATQVKQLQAVTAAHGQMLAREKLASDVLAGDVDWVRVLGQLASVMPPDLSLTSFSASRTNVVGEQSTSTPGTNPGIGTATFNVSGTGGLPAAAAWLQQLDGDPDFENLTISGITVKDNGGPVQFSSTANLTTTSESNRAKQVQQ